MDCLFPFTTGRSAVAAGRSGISNEPTRYGFSGHRPLVGRRGVGETYTRSTSVIGPRLKGTAIVAIVTGRVVVAASMRTAFDVAITTMLAAVGGVGSMLGASPCITQSSKSSLWGVGFRVFGFAPTISQAWPTANGAARV